MIFKINPTFIGVLSFIPAIATANTIKKICHLDSKLKWPNDVLIKNKKVAGALTEVNSTGNVLNFAILGLGVNLFQKRDCFDEIIRDKATSILIETRQEPSFYEMLTELLIQLDYLYDLFISNHHDIILEMWNTLTIDIGKPVFVNSRGRNYQGILAKIDFDGGLVVRLKNQNYKKFFAGECTLSGGVDAFNS